MFISVTRLRLRSLRFLPGFAWHTAASVRQLRRAPGFVAGQFAGEGLRGFWTVTAWEAEPNMRAYRNSAAHRRAMPKLLAWCDEASVAHWEQDTPELPAFQDEVTLRHLLTHTSGYHEAYGVLELRGTSTDVDLLRREDAVDVVRRQPTLEFPPGSKYQYNSTAYVILAEVAERVTGRPFPAWMAEHVFRPLGMRHTSIEAEVEAVMPGAASSYARAEGGGYRTAFSNRAYYGAADVYTTVGDLAAWLRNFRTAEVGGAGAIRVLTTPFVFTGGDTSAYALGIYVGKERGLRRLQHGGGHAGFSARITYYPDLDAGVAVMSNHPFFDATATSTAIVDVAFGDRMPPEQATPPAHAPSPGHSAPTPWLPSAEESAAYVGRYYSAEIETVYRVALGAGGLTLTHYRWGEMKLVPRSKDTFATTDPLPLTVLFERDREGRVTGFMASTVRTSGMAFEKQQ